MGISIEEAKAFIEDAKKEREDFLRMAEASWNEIKKVQSNGKPYNLKPTKKGRYPAWNSIFKIRQPLFLARVGIPIGKDTTQDGNDHIGATAAICLERLAVNLAKSFDFFGVALSCRDDFLATNFTTARAYYECEEVKEKIRERIQPQQMENGDVAFIDSEGNIVVTDNIMQDDEGYFIEHEETVDVEHEKVCLEPVHYKEIYVDPDVKRWQRAKRLAFELHFSERQFKHIFGAKAWLDLPKDGENRVGYDAAAPKKQNVKVFEYWDEYEKEVLWFAENGTDFIKPKAYYVPEGEDYEEDIDANGLYDLEGFFPVVTPAIINAPTDSLWPIPEYYQVVDILEDIHGIFTRMFQLTKAIVARIMFDKNIPGLEGALKEGYEGIAFGVPNLTNLLTAAGGKLENVAQYINVGPMIEALQLQYQNLEQRLNLLYKYTGTSDLLQGFVTDTTDRTYGERQLQEKYALNQVAEGQRKMQEFVRDMYQLCCEMALKNFKDSSLDTYIMPQTLPPEHQPRYRAAIGMLKQNPKRFRVELETDSTIAINEQYDKAIRIEFVNALTTALEKTAQIAEQKPELAVIELHALKHLIQGFRQGKLVQGEVTQAIDNVIKSAEQAAQNQPPPFNKDQVMAELEKQKLEIEVQKVQADNQIRVAQLQSDERLEVAKLQNNAALAAVQNQLEQFKAQVEAGQNQAELQLKYQELAAEISRTREELAIKQQELIVEAQKASDASQLEQFRLALDGQTAAVDAKLAEQQQLLEEQKNVLDQREKYMTEARLQSEHDLEQLRMKVEMMTMIKEANKEEPAKLPPVHLTIEQPAATKKRRKFKIERDEMGNPVSFEASDIEDPVAGE